LAIDTRDEDMLQALSNIEKYQDEARKWRNKKVHKQKISTGDMILRRKKEEWENWKKSGKARFGIRNKAGGLHIANLGRR
jgi:hypothetical protein